MIHKYKFSFLIQVHMTYLIKVCATQEDVWETSVVFVLSENDSYGTTACILNCFHVEF